MQVERWVDLYFFLTISSLFSCCSSFLCLIAAQQTPFFDYIHHRNLLRSFLEVQHGMASVALLINALIVSHQSLTLSKSMSKPTQTSVVIRLITALCSKSSSASLLPLYP